jgi:glycosyltransferase involved in cell wall biosynthesis
MVTQLQEKYDLSANRFTVIPFGVDDELFAPETGDDEKPRIVYTGNLGPGQAFVPFFEAFAQLDYDCELLVVGPGERRAELERLSTRLEISDRVTFAGPLPRKDIPETVAESALSWVPLKTEHSLDYARPTKFLETMAIGTPYVASVVTEIESITEKSGAGIAVENDSAEIAAAMRKLLSNAKLRREMGKRGVEFVNKHHRWEALGQTAGEVLSDAVGGVPAVPTQRVPIPK